MRSLLPYDGIGRVRFNGTLSTPLQVSAKELREGSNPPAPPRGTAVLPGRAARGLPHPRSCKGVEREGSNPPAPPRGTAADTCGSTPAMLFQKCRSRTVPKAAANIINFNSYLQEQPAICCGFANLPYPRRLIFRMRQPSLRHIAVHRKTTASRKPSHKHPRPN